LRSKRLYPQQVKAWKGLHAQPAAQRQGASQAGLVSKAKARQESASASWQRELHRKEKALAEAASTRCTAKKTSSMPTGATTAEES